MDPVDPNEASLKKILDLIGDRTGSKDETVSSTVKPACLSDLEIGELAAGVMPEERARNALAHVERCAACGARLKEAKGLMQRELTAEEETLLAGLSPAETERRLRGSSRPRTEFGWKWLIAACVLIGLAGTAWWISRARGSADIGRLMAQAYSAGRPFDFRVSLNVYGRKIALKGPEQDKPLPLKQAETKLAELRAAGAADASIAHLDGLVALWNSEPESAIGEFRKAISLNSDDPDLGVDLAVAQAFRGEQEGRASDYAAALDSLQRIHNTHPKHLAALFNLALVFERQQLFDQALDHWTKYLQLDPASEWSAEVRAHAAEIEVKKKDANRR